MATEAAKRAKKKYDQKNTKMVSLKLNKKYDGDILEQLDKAGNKQSYIKELIRQNIKEENETTQ